MGKQKYTSAQKQEVSDNLAKGMTRREISNLTDIPQGTLAHWQNPKKRSKLPIAQQPTSSEIATALLNTAVDAINKEQSLQEQLRVARSRIANLTEELTKTTAERDRVVKLHNEQVKYASKHGTELPSTEELMRAAKLR